MLRHKYDLIMDDQVVGTVHVAKEGLYYMIKCTYSSLQDGIYRAIVQNDHECINLGICIPEGDHFVANARIPISRIENDNVRFFIVSTKSKHAQGKPVAEDIPFELLDQLQTGRFTEIDGIPSIVITGQQPKG